jgi:hypothetical protein
MKTCIACAEEIQDAALLCRYCSTRQDDIGFLSGSSSIGSLTPTVSQVARRRTDIAWAAHLIEESSRSEAQYLESTVCNEANDVIKVLEAVLEEQPSQLNYSVSLRSNEGLFLKALGAAKDRGQNMHIRSLFEFNANYFCDGNFWQGDCTVDSLTTWDRMQTMKFVPHGRPIAAAAMIAVAEISRGKHLLQRPDNDDLEKDLNLVSQSVHELETALYAIEFAYPVIAEALRHDQYQNSLMNTTWRGDQKRYRPFPWP